jgi:hypothetical protein
MRPVRVRYIGCLDGKRVPGVGCGWSGFYAGCQRGVGLVVKRVDSGGITQLEGPFARVL